MLRLARRLFYDVLVPLSVSLLLLSLSLLIAGFALQQFPLGTLTSEKVYEIARDLLIILLAAAGVIVFGIYRILSFLIRQSIEKDMQKGFSAVKGGLALNLGLIYFNQPNYREAIHETQRALAEPGLEPRDRLAAANNLAYDYAGVERDALVQGLRRILTKPERAIALTLAQEAYRQYDQWRERPYNNPEIVETYLYVKATFARTAEERNEVQKLIRSAIANDALRPIRNELSRTLQFLDEQRTEEGAG